MTAVLPVDFPLDHPIRLGVLISGGGTTLQNLLDRIEDGRLSASVAHVIASRPGCGGIAKAEAAGIPADVVTRRDFSDVTEFSRSIFEKLRETQVELVLFGGFLSLVEIPDDFRHRAINIHPALIPAFCGQGFYGHHVHEAVLARGVKFSGCTVHFADNEYDHGPIILQECVPVLDNDTPDSLAARVFKAECEAYSAAISLYAAGRLTIDGSRVLISE
jgi:formyltetrahydrofolate-dependent phosphoribosylglycinamide formyltransferase